MKRHILLGFLALTVSAISLRAQVGINTEEPSPNSALHVTSPDSDKGVLLPQLTTADIENIPIVTTGGTPADPLSINEDGLVVYNQQTGCFSYWKQAANQWYSLCGTPPPAIVATECNVTERGIYIAGQVFNVNNYLQLTVNVISPGTYNITAVSDTDNGYYFTANGVFPAIGTYTINLTGAGTPTNAGVNTIKFTLNGKEATCTYSLTIQTPDPDYVITSVKQMPSVPWPVSQSLTGGTYYAEATLRVNKSGLWQLTTSSVNGYQFDGAGEIDAASGYNPLGSFPQFVTVNVPVSNGQATAYGTGADAFILSTLNSATPSNYPFNITLASVGFRIGNCAGITVNTNTGADFKQGVAVSNGSYIDIPLTVTSSGTTKVTAMFAGLTFETSQTNIAGAPDEIYMEAGVTTSIRLYPSTLGQIPNQSGSLPMQLISSKGGLDLQCAKNVTVDAAQAEFTNISWVSSTYEGVFTYDRVSNTNLQVPIVTLSVTANIAGSYNLSATQNGVTYSGSGSVPSGNSLILLNADPSHHPTTSGIKSVYSVSYPKTAATTGTVSFDIYFAYRKINILSLGQRGSGFDRPFPNATDESAANLILQNPANFGPTGTVCVGGFNIINGGSPSNATTLKQLINNNNIDIVYWMGDNEISNNALSQVIVDFINLKRGVFIYGEQRKAPAERFINMLYGTNIEAPHRTGKSQFLIENIPGDPILEGPFLPGGSTTLAGKYLGDDFSNGSRITTWASSAPPPSVKILARWRGTGGVYNEVFSFYDNDKGLFYCGDYAWANGRTNNNNSNNAWPSHQTGGVPGVKNSYTNGDNGNGTGSDGPVYNSYFYANVMAWAVKLAAERVNTSYILQ
ncbi:MAG: hypothetical protein LBD45_03570 [Bacteroidales bacterium]|jgi:hypothetical protein|nr:hypothetical protein [Bacteroidales bacterium]